MGILHRLLGLFLDRAEPGHDAYEAEVLFSGWVDLPPLFRAPRDEARRAADEPPLTPT